MFACAETTLTVLQLCAKPNDMSVAMTASGRRLDTEESFDRAVWRCWADALQRLGTLMHHACCGCTWLLYQRCDGACTHSVTVRAISLNIRSSVHSASFTCEVTCRMAATRTTLGTQRTVGSPDTCCCHMQAPCKHMKHALQCWLMTLVSVAAADSSTS